MVLARELTLSRGKALLGAALLGAHNLAAYRAFKYRVLLRVSDGLGAVVISNIPLMTLLFAYVQGQEPLR